MQQSNHSTHIHHKQQHQDATIFARFHMIYLFTYNTTIAGLTFYRPVTADVLDRCFGTSAKRAITGEET